MFYLSLIAFIILLFYDYKKSLHMAQQNLYNDDNRFLKWTIKDILNFKNSLKVSIIITLTYLILIIFNLKQELISNIYFFIMCIFILILKYKENKKNTTKISLKVTSRIKRLVITNIILFLVLILILYKFNVSNDVIYFSLLFYDLILNFIIMLSIIINKPIEKLVYLSYRKKAVNKLNSMPNLGVIGITGSYGKTSSKNILSDILNVKYNALASPKNFNTPYGLIITVNNHLDKFDDILIAEMGAYKKGEIKELCDLVKPKYGILTKIGTAHIEIFGSQKNIQEGKFELIESLPKDGIGILNADDELQKNYKLKNKCKILWIGIENDADVKASNIKLTKDGTCFDVVFKGDENKYSFKTRLLGYNNIYNILASLALAKEFSLSIEQMKKAVLNVKSVEHRLELRKAGNITYIDDSYNSNPVGSKMALDVLSQMGNLRIIMTPGMVELGDKSYELNKEFGKYMKDTCDIVILVGEKITKPIKDGLDEVKFNNSNIHIVNSTNEAFSLVRKITSNKEAFVLIENDLPDIYNE